MGFEYAAQLKYAVAEQVSLGVEAFGEIENIDDVPSFNETEFRIGPVGVRVMAKDYLTSLDWDRVDDVTLRNRASRRANNLAFTAGLTVGF